MVANAQQYNNGVTVNDPSPPPGGPTIAAPLGNDGLIGKHRRAHAGVAMYGFGNTENTVSNADANPVPAFDAPSGFGINNATTTGGWKRQYQGRRRLAADDEPAWPRSMGSRRTSIRPRRCS